MSDNKDSDERDHVSKNYEVIVSDVIEDLKLGKLRLHKNLENVDKDSNKRNQMNMSDEMKSAETDQTSKMTKTHSMTLMKNLMIQIRQENVKKMVYNQKNQNLMKDIIQKIRNHLKGLIDKKQREC